MSIEHHARSRRRQGLLHVRTRRLLLDDERRLAHNASINYALQNVSTVTSCDAVVAANHR